MRFSYRVGLCICEKTKYRGRHGQWPSNYNLLHMERALCRCKQDIFAYVLTPEIPTSIFKGAASFGIEELISMLSINEYIPCMQSRVGRALAKRIVSTTRTAKI